MADGQTGGSKFWGDLSRKAGTWSAVSALALGIAEHVDDQPWSGPEWEQWAAVIGAAVIRAVVGLVQGKVGDPDKASFAPAPAVGQDAAPTE